MAIRVLNLTGLVLAGFFLGGCNQGHELLTNGYGRTVTARGDLAASEQATIELFEKASPSVVQIITLTRLEANPDFAAIGAGSGFVWDDAGHIVTNNHVVEASEIIVRWPTGAKAQARVVGRAPNLDIAVLALADGAKAPPLPIGSSADLKVGQASFAIGNPFGLDCTLTTGVISAVERRLPTSSGREILGVIQTDAAINPGNSGGPLLDSAGRVIGVTTAIVSPSGASSGVGFAVPIDTVRKAVPQLIEKGRMATPGIGILTADETTAARLGIDGVLVWRVFDGSPGQDAGLKGTDVVSGELGDIITAINGKPVHRLSDLTAEFDRIGVGAAADLVVLRKDRAVSIRIAVEDVATS
jgi:2-alkenal reductase